LVFWQGADLVHPQLPQGVQIELAQPSNVRFDRLVHYARNRVQFPTRYT
jgi:hypothetical protein